LVLSARGAAGKKVEVLVAMRTESRNRSDRFVHVAMMLLKAGATNSEGRISALDRKAKIRVLAHPVLVRNAKAAAGKKVETGVATRIVDQAGESPKHRIVGNGWPQP